MLESMKYIIVKGSFGEELPFLFNCTVSHNTLFRKEDIVAAGFCRIVATRKRSDKYDIESNEFEVTCFGKSSSIGIGSRAIDKEIIHEMLTNPLKF